MTRMTWAAMVLCLAACKQAAPSLPLRIDDSEGFADLDVPAELISSSAQSIVVRTRATVEGRPIDIEVRFLGLAGGHTSVEMRPNGDDGDALLAAMAAAWKQPARPRHMRALVSAPIAVLGPRDPALATKAFFHDGADEVYLNWDPAKKLLGIHEKDMGYRAGVLAALSR